VVAHEVAGHLIESFVGCDDVILALQLFFKTLLDIDVIGLNGFDLLQLRHYDLQQILLQIYLQ
jgi:hypothetical protein